MSNSAFSSNHSSGVLTATEISKYSGANVVLNRVCLSVHTGSRMGVVGPNGIGKTTLLRILAGLVPPDVGRVSRNPESLWVAYLPQEPDARPGETLLDYLGRNTGVEEATAELEARAEALARDPFAAGAYSEALDRFLAVGGDSFDARAAKTCADVGLPASFLHRPITEMSGGEAARASLASKLLARHDILLMDEPTNNLDFTGLDVLERFVGSTSAGIVVVSHDRDFLARTVNTIVEIEEGEHRAIQYTGGFDEYLAARRRSQEEQNRAHERYVEERARLIEQMRRKRRWAAAGAARARRRPSDSDKFLRGARIEAAEKAASRVRAIEQKLERLEGADKVWEGWDLHMAINPARRGGDVVVRLERAVIARGQWQLGPLDVEVLWGERVLISGPNGSGKSTLLAALVGGLQLAAGTRFIGPGVVIGEMDQARAVFSRPTPLVDVFCRQTGSLEEEARSLLAKFGLGAGDVVRATAQLSPGERSRAVLAMFMYRKVNCLVLDEPTNHLDLPAIEEMEKALGNFSGTVLLVTHDRRLRDNFDSTRTIELARRA